MTFNADYAGYPNYFPNSFSGPGNVPEAVEHKIQVSGDVARYNTSDDDNFSQVTTFWTKVLNEPARARLVENIAGHLKNAQPFIQVWFASRNISFLPRTKLMCFHDRIELLRTLDRRIPILEAACAQL